MPSTAELIAYAKIMHINVRDGGLQVNVGTASAPIVVDVASDADGRSLVLGCMQDVGLAAQLGQTAPTFDWDNDDDTTTSLSADQMRTLALGLYAFLQSTYAARRSVIAAVSAGSLATFASIGDPSLWPIATPAAASTPATAS